MPYAASDRLRDQVGLLLQLAESNYSEAQLSAMVQLSLLGEAAVPALLEALAFPRGERAGGVIVNASRTRTPVRNLDFPQDG